MPYVTRFRKYLRTDDFENSTITLEAVPDDATVITKKQWDSFLARIEHGDEEHRKWLREEFRKEWEVVGPEE